MHHGKWPDKGSDVTDSAGARSPGRGAATEWAGPYLAFMFNLHRSRVVLVFSALALCHTTARPQAQLQEVKGLYFGLGMGQDLGGLLGVGFTYWPTPWVSGFVGGGWALVDLSYQVGAEVRLPNTKLASPFLTAMYGYNGAIHIEGKESLDGVYTGATVGAGVILRHRFRRNYWRFSLNAPIRSKDFLDDWQAIKDRPDVEIKQDLLPVTVGVGYHFGL
jgi:hypothetical protein